MPVVLDVTLFLRIERSRCQAYAVIMFRAGNETVARWSARRHAQGAVETDNFAIEHLILNDVAHEG